MESEVVGIRRAEAEDLSALKQLVVESDPGFSLSAWEQRVSQKGVFTYLVEQSDLFGFVTAGSADLQEASMGKSSRFILRPNTAVLDLVRNS